MDHRVRHMLDPHQHPPQADDTRNIKIISPRGDPVNINPLDYPREWCLCPDCPLNPRIVEGSAGDYVLMADNVSMADRPDDTDLPGDGNTTKYKSTSTRGTLRSYHLQPSPTSTLPLIRTLSRSLRTDRAQHHV